MRGACVHVVSHHLITPSCHQLQEGWVALSSSNAWQTACHDLQPSVRKAREYKWMWRRDSYGLCITEGALYHLLLIRATLLLQPWHWNESGEKKTDNQSTYYERYQKGHQQTQVQVESYTSDRLKDKTMELGLALFFFPPTGGKTEFGLAEDALIYTISSSLIPNSHLHNPVILKYSKLLCS